MTQHDLDREVARATGETVTTIRRLGFSIVETDEPEPAINRIADREEIDVDELVHARFDVDNPAELSISQASTLIDELKRVAPAARS